MESIIVDIKFTLENEMFDVVTNLYLCYYNKDKASYDALLDILEELNNEYEKNYGLPKYSNHQLLDFHSKKWEFYA